MRLMIILAGLLIACGEKEDDTAEEVTEEAVEETGEETSEE